MESLVPTQADKIPKGPYMLLSTSNISPWEIVRILGFFVARSNLFIKQTTNFLDFACENQDNCYFYEIYLLLIYKTFSVLMN